ILLGFALALGAASAAVNETPYELQSDGDFDGDGRRDLIILDKGTGNYRIAYQLSLDQYSWVPTRASGVPNATGLGLGKLTALTFDALAITGPDANCVNLITANSPSAAGLPSSIYLPSLGPNLVTAIDIGGGGNTAHDDLYVASLYNGASPYRQTLVRSTGSTNQTVLTDTPLPYLRERGNSVLLHTNRAARLALFERNTAPTNDLFDIFDLSGFGAVSVASIATLRTPRPFEYVSGQFVRTNPYT